MTEGLDKLQNERNMWVQVIERLYDGSEKPVGFFEMQSVPCVGDFVFGRDPVASLKYKTIEVHHIGRPWGAKHLSNLPTVHVLVEYIGAELFDPQRR
jgi:hypothetical protein